MDKFVSCWYKPRGITVFLIVFLLCFKIIIELKDKELTESSEKNKGFFELQSTTIRTLKKKSEHRLAVLIPFRNCYAEMTILVPRLHKLLSKQNIDHQIYVINQSDSFRFNRAQLLNAGYLESRSECDYIAIHDVDLLPLNEKLIYAYPKNAPLHLSPPGLHPVYGYPTFMGGVLLMNNNQFQMLNGFSTKHWGWGKEDDEFSMRLKQANLTPERPKGITTGKRHTFRHIHDRNKRPRDRTNYFGQEKIAFKRDYHSGLNTTFYRIITKTNIQIRNAPLTVIDVHLMCNITSTPWCMNPSQHEAITYHFNTKLKQETVLNETLKEKYTNILRTMDLNDFILENNAPS